MKCYNAQSRRQKTSEKCRSLFARNLSSADLICLHLWKKTYIYIPLRICMRIVRDCMMTKPLSIEEIKINIYNISYSISKNSSCYMERLSRDSLHEVDLKKHTVWIDEYKISLLWEKYRHYTPNCRHRRENHFVKTFVHISSPLEL
jgi:hypothetical protein